jgi:hypothetical protein
LWITVLVGLIALPAAAQEVPSDDLLLRLYADALQAGNAPPALATLEDALDRPSPYTAAAIHPHNGRWSVTISQGTLTEGGALSRFLSDKTAEFFFYNRVLGEQERDALRDYTATNYNAADGGDSNGLDQGIHVQGSWSIEVRDRDGSLVERRDFENELVSSGARLLSELLVSSTTAGNVKVYVSGDSPPCTTLSDGAGDPIGCLIIETGQDPAASPEDFANLTKEVPDSGDNSGALVLDGSFTAQRESDVSIVEAGLYDTCVPDLAPANCTYEMGTNSAGGRTLTSTTLEEGSDTPPVDVSEGQQVNVEVIISFN